MLELFAWIAMLAGPAMPPVDELLKTLVANGERYQKVLPSLTCEESLVSQTLKKDKVKEEVNVVATVRVQRNDDPQNPFTEHNTFHSRNGAPVTGDNIRMPYFVQGAFVNGLGFSSGSRIACFDTALTTETGNEAVWRLDLRLKQDTTGNEVCASIPKGMTLTLLVDKATQHIMHLVRVLPDESASQSHNPPYVELDYAPTLLGEETFWLPTNGTIADAKVARRMKVEYSGCKRFTGTARIIGDIEKVPEP